MLDNLLSLPCLEEGKTNFFVGTKPRFYDCVYAKLVRFIFVPKFQEVSSEIWMKNDDMPLVL